MTLGMSKRKISKILLSETLIVGVLSLIAGLLLGLVVSQGLSLFTAKLFDVGMTEFKFIISSSAILKTVLYFALIFGVLMIFNTRIIAKYKLIDMLTAARKSEDIKIKNPITVSYTHLILVSYINISNNIRLESEIQAHKLNDIKKAEFISTLSHELKTPLNIFASSVQLLDSFSDGDKEEFVYKYKKHSPYLALNCKRMLRLINNIICLLYTYRCV